MPSMFVPHFIGVGEFFLLRGEGNCPKNGEQEGGAGEEVNKSGKFSAKFPCRVFLVTVSSNRENILKIVVPSLQVSGTPLP